MTPRNWRFGFTHPSHCADDPQLSQILSLICGNKMPTRSNVSFYCRSYCLLNMFRASLCPSSGAQEYLKNHRYVLLHFKCMQLSTTSTVTQSHPTNGIPDPQTKLYTAKKPTKNTHTQPPRHSTHLVTNLDNTRHFKTENTNSTKT